ncbi:MAG: hypothetical protein H8E29_10420 [Anaerolineales bacterium]|uniref:Uncharacterized protein n=1 Tax=Candidatus Desulfolinea nitratireducens TaxID=2841698 RepID=A0A8J6NMH4_9CHLR|nr:hypothetical protein [Candidatus Desulfolinea nitratireducens]
MELRNVFVVGDSLFAETLIQLLGDSQTVSVIGTAPTPEDAIPKLKSQTPDAVIVAVADESIVAAFTPILIANPNLPIIHADLNTNQMQVITNQSIDARVSDLLAAIAALPKQDASKDENIKA